MTRHHPTAVAPEREPLPVALRAWMAPDRSRKPSHGQRREPDGGRWRTGVLSFDMETTTDAAQQLTFGWYRYGRWRDDGTLDILMEGIVVADNLAARDPAGLDLIRAYAATHAADVVEGMESRHALPIQPRAEFVDDVLWPAIQADALIVGFNLPFDLSRLAVGVGAARGRYLGGFSFRLWEYIDAAGVRRDHQFRPRVLIRHLDSKRALIGITQPNGRPRGHDGRPVVYQPGFLDLRTLAFALTDRGYSLASVCEAFGVSGGKADPGEHGAITPDYIAYARQDVAATAALLESLRTEYDRHPITLDPCRALSPATIAKSYYDAMGIVPRLESQPDFPPEILGAAMSAYYGGRTEGAIRRVSVPVVYTDVLSMYPTVNALLGLWTWHTAATLTPEDCTDAAQAMLDTLSLDGLLDPSRWPALAFFGQMVPDGDVLPVRAPFDGPSQPDNIAVTPYTASRPQWFTGPDLAASVLLTGKVPRLIRAFRVCPSGTQPGLRPVYLGGEIPIDPTGEDFFRAVIEQRKRVATDPTLPDATRKRLDKFLKVLANSGSYGVFIESNPRDLPAETTERLTLYGGSAPVSVATAHPEDPGRFSFPPAAALITGGARLVLTLLERLVTDRGGHYAFCDTDSMAIVASERGGLVACPGGGERLPDGTAAIHALTWADVAAIAACLVALNPYDPAAVPGSILKVEAVNFDAAGHQREVSCVAIAAKRYALYMTDAAGEPEIVEFKRHGLGYLIDPRDPGDDDGDAPAPYRDGWEAAVWQEVVRDVLRLPTQPPPWGERPAVYRLNVASVPVWRTFASANRGKSYADSIKPFNFLMATLPADAGRPAGIDQSDRFRLIAPYESNPRRWDRIAWTDLYSGNQYRVTTAWPKTDPATAGIKRLANIAAAYGYHPEPKRLGPNGRPCGKQTVGLLSRRPVTCGGVRHVGKEAANLDARPLLARAEDAVTGYDARKLSLSELTILQARCCQPGELATVAERVGMTPRRLRDVLTGRSTPHPALRRQIADLAAVSSQSPARTCAGCGRALPLDADRRRTYCGERCAARDRQRRHRHSPTARPCPVRRAEAA